jgi:ubiquinone/menaquinone biosynthesis C-methylase UbiE
MLQALAAGDLQRPLLGVMVKACRRPAERYALSQVRREAWSAVSDACKRLEAAMAVPGATVASFNTWAGDYDHSVLQPTLYVPVHQTALQLAQELVRRPRRILDVGCGTARLLRQARLRYPQAELVGVDLAWRMITTASAATPAEPPVRYVHASAERLPFTHDTFDLVFATLSLRHWTDPAAGIAQIARVLIPGGVLVVADLFQATRRRMAAARVLRRRRQAVPAELATLLAAHRLSVVAQDRIPWFALPDIQLIAVQKS